MDDLQTPASCLAIYADRFSEVSRDRAVALAEMQAPLQVAIRGNANDERFTDALAGLVPCALPTTACSVSKAADGTKFLWLGPDEWLLIGTRESRVTTASLTGAFAGMHATAVDVSMARLILQLKGPDARNVLEKLCLLDLHPRAFAPGTVAGTVMVKTQVVLEQIDEQPTYHLYVRPSFARHLAEMIMDAMAEFAEA